MGDDWIRDALARGVPTGQFELELQPVIRISTGEVWGAESFLRWRHPERGRVAPGAWLPVAAATGALVELTLRAIADVDTLAAELGGPVLSVNLDAVVLSDDRLAGVTDPAAPGRLAVEIHHLHFPTALGGLVERLSSLREQGIAVWLDDLGDQEDDGVDPAHPEIDVVKLDRRMLGRPRPELTNLVTRLRAAGKEVIVEGVETADEEEVVVGAGIDLAQGFKYSFPLAVDGFRALCQGGRHG